MAPIRAATSSSCTLVPKQRAAQVRIAADVIDAATCRNAAPLTALMIVVSKSLSPKGASPTVAIVTKRT